jgi:hypothetical protein
VTNDGTETEAGGEPAARTLWQLYKDGQKVTCLLVGRPGHEELRVLIDSDLYLSEMHTVHDGALGRATTLRHGFEKHGWSA